MKCLSGRPYGQCLDMLDAVPFWGPGAVGLFLVSFGVVYAIRKLEAKHD